MEVGCCDAMGGISRHTKMVTADREEIERRTHSVADVLGMLNAFKTCPCDADMKHCECDQLATILHSSECCWKYSIW